MKPLLAYTVDDFAALRFPVLASPKLDGIRCLIVNGEAVTRNLKPIPNLYVQHRLRGLPDLDGELIVGSSTVPDCFTRSTSGIMSIHGEPGFLFHVFDHWSHGGAFAHRVMSAARHVLDAFLDAPLRMVEHVQIETARDLLAYEAETVAAGYEGVMIRDPGGVYKHGRSTARESILGKVKRFHDSEGEVVGVEELHHNGNAAEVNALGLTERSTAKAGLMAGGTLGALIVRAPGWAEPFKIGTGFTADQRATFWSQRHALKGRVVKFKHQPAGEKDKPRFPVFLGWRLD